MAVATVGSKKKFTGKPGKRQTFEQAKAGIIKQYGKVFAKLAK